MFRFWEYCFYRVADTKLIKELVSEVFSSVTSCGYISLFQIMNLCTILNLISMPRFLFWTITVLADFIILFYNFQIMNDNKYEELKAKHKDEPHRVLKGFGVIMYMLISFILVILSFFYVNDSV